MSRSTRLGTGSLGKVDYQKLSAGTNEPSPSVSMYYVNTTTSPKKPKIQNTSKQVLSHKKENGMVRHLHAKRKVQDFRFNWPCLQCGFQQLSSEMDLAQHLDLCEGIPKSGSFVPGFNGIQLECPLCTANEFPYLQELDSHIVVCHSDEIDDDGPFICKYCDLNFTSLLPLVQHKLIYHQIYPNLEYESQDIECKCSGCNSLFQSENDLAAHYEECIQQEEEDPDNPVASCPGLVMLEPLTYLEPVTAVVKGSEYLPQLSDEQHRRNNELTAAFEAKYPLARIGLRLHDTPNSKRPSPYKTTDWIELSRPIQPKSKVASEKLALLNKKKAEQIKKKQSEITKKRQNKNQSVVAEEEEDLIAGPLQVGSITFSCSQCNNKFSSQSNLQKHITHAHSENAMSSLDDTINNVLSNLESLPQLQVSPPKEQETRMPGSPVKQIVSRSEEISPGSGRTGFMSKMKKIHDLKRSQREDEQLSGCEQIDHYNFDTAQDDALNPEDVATFEDFMKNLQTDVDEQPPRKSKKLSVSKKSKTPSQKGSSRPLKSLSRPLKARPVVTPKVPFSQIGQAGGIYSCPLCMESFELLRSRDDHLREIHNGERVFACQICGVSFSLYGFLNAHCKRVHLDNLEWALYGDPDADSMPHECNYCTVAFFTTSVLKSHVQIMHPDAPKPTRGRRSKKQIQLDEEAKMKSITESQSASLVRRHNEMTGASYLCTECSAEFTDEMQVRQHMMQEHPPSDEDNGAKLNSQSITNYQDLVGSEDDDKEQEISLCIPTGSCAPMCCIICQDEIHNPLEFEIHFTSHVDSPQNLGCPVCNRVFTGPNAQQNLSDHSHIDHRGRAPYSCSKCPAIFTLQHDLVRHRVGGQCRPVDIPPDTLEDVVVYGCPDCGKFFAGDDEKYRLEEHKLVHLEEAATSETDDPRNEGNIQGVVMQSDAPGNVLSMPDWDKENQHQVMLMYQEEQADSAGMEEDDSEEHLIMSDDNSRV